MLARIRVESCRISCLHTLQLKTGFLSLRQVFLQDQILDAFTSNPMCRFCLFCSVFKCQCTYRKQQAQKSHSHSGLTYFNVVGIVSWLVGFDACFSQSKYGFPLRLLHTWKQSINLEQYHFTLLVMRDSSQIGPFMRSTLVRLTQTSSESTEMRQTKDNITNVQNENKNA